jgi:cold-inducible RNA-binding protein
MQALGIFRLSCDGICWCSGDFISLGGSMGTRLYVGNISFGASEEDLQNHFAQAGEVANVKLIKDNATGRLRGFGFVEMVSDADGQKAISMFNGQQFMDRAIVVNEAKPMEKREGGFRQRSGGRGGSRDRD